MIKIFLAAAAMMLFTLPAFSQCGFQVKDVTIRHDQYSASTKTNDEKSQAQSKAQLHQFDKRKYQTLLADKKTIDKKKTVMRFR